MMNRREFLIGSALSFLAYGIAKAEDTVGGLTGSIRNLDEYEVADRFFRSLRPSPLEGLSSITLSYALDSGMKFNGIGDIYLRRDTGYVAGARVQKSGGLGLQVKKIIGILPGVSSPNLNVGIESHLDMVDGRLKPNRLEVTDYEHEQKKTMVWGRRQEEDEMLAPYAFEDPLSRFSNYVFLDGMDTLTDRIVSLTTKGDMQEAAIKTVHEPHMKDGRQFEYKMKMRGGVMGMVEGDVSMNLAKQGRIRLPVNAFADLMGTGVYIRLLDAKTVYS
jgi:hypothetical protein